MALAVPVHPVILDQKSHPVAEPGTSRKKDGDSIIKMVLTQQERERKMQMVLSMRI